MSMIFALILAFICSIISFRSPPKFNPPPPNAAPRFKPPPGEVWSLRPPPPNAAVKFRLPPGVPPSFKLLPVPVPDPPPNAPSFKGSAPILVAECWPPKFRFKSPPFETVILLLSKIYKFRGFFSGEAVAIKGFTLAVTLLDVEDAYNFNRFYNIIFYIFIL